MIILTEYEAFGRLRDGLAMAKDGALSLARHRPDQAAQWNKMAQVYQVSMDACMQLLRESLAKNNGVN